MTTSSWVEAKRKEELLKMIYDRNKDGDMPSTTEIYNNCDMAKATAHKYLQVLRAEGKVEFKVMGTTYLWYLVTDDHGNKVEPKTYFRLCG